MGSQSEVMHCYEQIAPLTERMLLLARTKQWGALPALEAQYSGMVDRLKVIEPLETLDEAQAARKYQLLSRITANSTDIFGMVMPQLAKLVTLMKSLEQQQSLERTYGQGDASS
ncbi:flagellar protein FliT [Polaromonas sp.]|jgi:flagellar protein FliT|uniref:flagellar protein FliT n=1 Tax=Polaromonas sp. TaxID=1869339 RepID=UPI0037CC35F9